jgi:hypothetical protein
MQQVTSNNGLAPVLNDLDLEVVTGGKALAGAALAPDIEKIGAQMGANVGAQMGTSLGQSMGS